MVLADANPDTFCITKDPALIQVISGQTTDEIKTRIQLLHGGLSRRLPVLPSQLNDRFPTGFSIHQHCQPYHL